MGEGLFGMRATGLLLLAALLPGCGDDGSAPAGDPASSASSGAGGQAQNGGAGGEASASGGGGDGGGVATSPCTGDASVVFCMDFDASSDPADGWAIVQQGFLPDADEVTATIDATQWTSPPQSLRLAVAPGAPASFSLFRQTDAALDEVGWVELSLDLRVDGPMVAGIAGLTQQLARTTQLQLDGDALSVGVYDPNTGEGEQLTLPSRVAFQTWTHVAIRVAADGVVTATVDDGAPVQQSFDPAAAILKVGLFIGFASSLEEQSGGVQFDNVILRAGG